MLVVVDQRNVIVRLWLSGGFVRLTFSTFLGLDLFVGLGSVRALAQDGMNPAGLPLC